MTIHTITYLRLTMNVPDMRVVRKKIRMIGATAEMFYKSKVLWF